MILGIELIVRTKILRVFCFFRGHDWKDFETGVIGWPLEDKGIITASYCQRCWKDHD